MDNTPEVIGLPVFMFRGALILFSCLSAATTLLSQTASILDARFNGNRVISSAELREEIARLPGSLFSLENVGNELGAIKRRYALDGYYFAKVELDSLVWSADSLGVTPYVSISEGARAVLGEIHIQGNNLLSEEIVLQSFDTKTGSVLDQGILEQDLKHLVEQYERAGYPFVTTSVENVAFSSRDSSTLSLTLGIDEGPRVAIHEIRVVGNTETSEHVIVRETRIRENELFDEEKVSKIQPRLRRLNIFSSVREPQVFVNEAGGGLLLEVEEGKTNTFDGILGYIPAGGGQSGHITGFVNIGMRNLFGTARRLQIRWQRDDSYSQEVAAHYTEPWLFDLPVNISAGFFQRQQDSSYVRRMIDFRGEVPLFDAFSIIGTLHREDIIPSGTITVPQVGRSKKLLAGLELLYDTRDDPVSPLSGVRYRASYETGSKHIETPTPSGSPFPEKKTVQKIGIDAEFYFEALPRQVVRLAMDGRQITTDNLEPGDYFQFGGATTLRGYREHQFQGSVTAWTNAEYRFLLSRRSFVYGCFDTGFYFIPSDDARGVTSSQDFLFGYGVGFRIDTSVGNLGVSIALGKGDPPAQAKLHVLLVNDF